MLKTVNWSCILTSLVQFGCVVAFLVQAANVLDDFFKPTLTNTNIEQRNLKNFPLTFKICIKPGFNLTALKEAGYNNPWAYFTGQSRYNESELGWAGHHNGSLQHGDAKEVLDKVSFHTAVGTVLKSVFMWSMSTELVILDIKPYLSRVNNPHNCLTLNIANHTNLKEKGIKQLFLEFENTRNVSVEIHVQGSSLVCNRNIKAHTFYSSNPISLENVKGKWKSYAVDINENVYMEEDKTKNCRIYPNQDFETYRWVVNRLCNIFTYKPTSQGL